jgi:hypothetical protein
MWRHRSIADSRPGHLSSRAPAPCTLGEILPPWWNRLAFRLHRTATRSTSERGNVPTASFQHDTILGATGAAAVSH